MAYKQENNAEISRYYYLFRKNKILKLNKNDGIRYLQNSYDKGNLYSMFHFGLMLINGDGFESDKNKGFKYIKKVADSGNLDAMFLYGKCKLNECISDKKEAVNYLKMASDKNHPDSLLEYGNLLIKGDLVPMNKEEGLRCIKMLMQFSNSV